MNSVESITKQPSFIGQLRYCSENSQVKNWTSDGDTRLKSGEEVKSVQSGILNVKEPLVLKHFGVSSSHVPISKSIPS